MGVQLVIGFFYLFKGSLGQKFNGPHLKNLLWSLSEDKGAPLHVDQPIQMKDISFICFLCRKIWFCIPYKTHSGSDIHGSISFMIDNTHYINFRI